MRPLGSPPVVEDSEPVPPAPAGAAADGIIRLAEVDIWELLGSGEVAAVYRSPDLAMRVRIARFRLLSLVTCPPSWPRDTGPTLPWPPADGSS